VEDHLSQHLQFEMAQSYLLARETQYLSGSNLREKICNNTKLEKAAFHK